MREVDLFCRSLAGSRSSDLLSPDELARAARFRFEKHRNRFIACRSALREILGEYLDTDPRAIEFAYNPHGKPAVTGVHFGVHFNVSHSGELAVIAVSRTRELGVDVERIDPRFAGEQIPERFFSAAEIAALRSLPEHLQIEAFFLCWTRKEAYVKARGVGLSLELSSFDVTLAPGEPAAFLRGADGWEIEAFTPAPGFAAAVVAKL